MFQKLTSRYLQSLTAGLKPPSQSTYGSISSIIWELLKELAILSRCLWMLLANFGYSYSFLEFHMLDFQTHFTLCHKATSTKKMDRSLLLPIVKVSSIHTWQRWEHSIQRWIPLSTTMAVWSLENSCKINMIALHGLSSFWLLF